MYNEMRMMRVVKVVRVVRVVRVGMCDRESGHVKHTTTSLRPAYLSAQTAFYSLNPDRDIPGPLAINLLI
jgi:hypothetical protein